MLAGAHARFALIGAGGLGGPVAYALAAAGAGRLVLCDPDLVELSNLQRQVQFTTGEIGRTKVDALAGELERRGYPAARLRRHAIRFAADTADEILRGVDVVVEGSDDPATKFAVNDAALARGLAVAIGGVERYGGHVLAAVPTRTACYRCLFEDPPPPEESPACADAGVLGAVVATVGGLLAAAALGLAAGSVTGAEILVVDDARRRSAPRRVSYNPRPGCPACRAARLVPAPEPS